MTGSESYEQLVERVQQSGSEERHEAFNTLIAKFEQAAYRWAINMLEDNDAAQDAVQEACLTAFLHLEELREPRAFPAWFRQIVLTCCHRITRREKPTTELSEHHATAPDLADTVEDNERRESVTQAVFALPERERIVTELFYFKDYSQQEIAQVLAVPITTVKKRLQYAREHLRHLIPDDFVAMLPDYAYALNGGCTAAAIGYYVDSYDSYRVGTISDVIINSPSLWGEGLQISTVGFTADQGFVQGVRQP
jgi:RNA polymerase sigma factor (sigma-70 family)